MVFKDELVGAALLLLAMLGGVHYVALIILKQ